MLSKWLVMCCKNCFCKGLSISKIEKWDLLYFCMAIKPINCLYSAKRAVSLPIVHLKVTGYPLINFVGANVQCLKQGVITVNL